MQNTWYLVPGMFFFSMDSLSWLSRFCHFCPVHREVPTPLNLERGSNCCRLRTSIVGVHTYIYRVIRTAFATRILQHQLSSAVLPKYYNPEIWRPGISLVVAGSTIIYEVRYFFSVHEAGGIHASGRAWQECVFCKFDIYTISTLYEKKTIMRMLFLHQLFPDSAG